MATIRVVLRTTRLVTKSECPWLDADVPEGTTAIRYFGPTYGCINWEHGQPVMFTEEGTFFEFPHDALCEV